MSRPSWDSQFRETEAERNQRLGHRRVIRSRGALQKLRELEAEIREQASGSQDGYLLDVANRMRAELSKFT